MGLLDFDFAKLMDNPSFQMGMGILANPSGNFFKQVGGGALTGMQNMQNFKRQQQLDKYNTQQQELLGFHYDNERMRAENDRKKLLAQQQEKRASAESDMKMLKAIFQGQNFGIMEAGDEYDVTPAAYWDDGRPKNVTVASKEPKPTTSAPQFNSGNAKMYGFTPEDLDYVSTLWAADPKEAVREMREIRKAIRKATPEARGKIAEFRAYQAFSPEERKEFDVYRNAGKVPLVDMRGANFGPGGDPEFRKKASEKSGAEFGKYIVELRQNADTAYQTADEIGSIVDMLEGYNGGPWDTIKASIGKYFPGTDWANISSLNEAANSIRSKLAPSMRVIGSGATSDFEMKMWLDAVPSLMMTSNGRNLVKKYATRLADRSAMKADIEMSEYERTGSLPTAKRVREELSRQFKSFLDQEDKAFLGGGRQAPQVNQTEAKGTATAPHVVKSDADYAKVPPGAYYTAPDGTTRRKGK